jgi:hypothetical protein
MRTRQLTFSILAILITLVAYQGAYAAQETTVTLSFDRDQFLFDQVRGYDRVRLIDGSIVARFSSTRCAAMTGCG